MNFSFWFSHQAISLVAKQLEKMSDIRPIDVWMIANRK